MVTIRYEKDLSVVFSNDSHSHNLLSVFFDCGVVACWLTTQYVKKEDTTASFLW